MSSINFSNALLAVALAGLVVGCGAAGGDARTADMGDPAAALGGAASMHAAMATGRQRAVPMAGLPGASFASLPDRGDLVAYTATPVVRRAGPYTWHRADVSEAHALRAIGDVMTITAPSGERLRYQYDRHVEHPTGDWTWIGHLVGGTQADDAIITFGANAVLGTIARPGKSAVKLMMQDGVSWLVETDRAQLSLRSRAEGWYERPDFVIPSSLPGGSASSMPGGARALQAPLAGIAPAAAGPTTVDVLIGYTPGFVAGNMGGPGGNLSFASTTLNSMVDITNESYVNSGLNLQIRLVHTMQVEYQDATANRDALYDLTGYDGSIERPVPAALQALHSARDQYGADLVTLVRRFTHPENESCGVAWLIGGGQTPTDAQYDVLGFSVVSQGTDGGYQCNDTTYAHELGHNMGLAHDAQTMAGDDGVLQSNEYGRYSYSFGYRTGPTEGHFYTVMAYSDDQVVGYKVFSNPDVAFCGGFACGVANQADNARTLRQTVPVVATFRAQVVPGGAPPPPSDFDGDGRSDILWRNDTNGQGVVWKGASAFTVQHVSTVADLAWQNAGTGDFNGDGQADILWRNNANGQSIIWLSGSSGTPRGVATVADLQWKVAGVGDFNGDGQDDILWRNDSTGQNTIWRSANAGTPQGVSTVADPQWAIVGVGDFNGDGADDILWRNALNGQNIMWRSGSSATPQGMSSVPDPAWKAAAAGDFNGDGQDDILWRNDSTGQNIIWRSGSSATPQAMETVGDTAWTVVAVGDYDGDGEADILWRNLGDGQNFLWYSGSSAQGAPATTVTDLNWVVVG